MSPEEHITAAEGWLDSLAKGRFAPDAMAGAALAARAHIEMARYYQSLPVQSVAPAVARCETCDMDASPGESRFCPECETHEPVCINDHCMECGSST